MKAAGRFSAKHNKCNFPVCDRCSTEHEPQRCPSNGKPCFSCGGKNHFAGSTSCPNTKKEQVDGKSSEETDESKKKNQTSSSTKRIAAHLYRNFRKILLTVDLRSKKNMDRKIENSFFLIKRPNERKA